MFKLINENTTSYLILGKRYFFLKIISYLFFFNYLRGSLDFFNHHSHKMFLHLTHRFGSYRAFKNVKSEDLPTFFLRLNKSAWMTSALLEDHV